MTKQTDRWHGLGGMRGVARMGACAAVMGFAAWVGACTSQDAASSRDFNELIPRITNAVKGKTPTEAASNLFNVTSPDERRDAIAYLQTKTWGHQKPYMDAYKVLATDPHPMVRGQAYRALGTSHDQSVVELLVKGINDSDATVRQDASWALCLTYNDSALDAVTAHAKDDVNEQVQINCVSALRWSKDQKAIRTLISALDNTNAAIALTAWDSLKFNTGQKLPMDDSRAWNKWYQVTYIGPTATQSGS